MGSGWARLDVSGCHSRCGIALPKAVLEPPSWWHHAMMASSPWALPYAVARRHVGDTERARTTMQMSPSHDLREAQGSARWLQHWQPGSPFNFSFKRLLDFIFGICMQECR